MICLTVDCEQWTSPKARGMDVPENNNTDFSRLGNNRLLKLFDEYGVKSTFFITGFFAEREKEHVVALKKNGHEIGCHGYGHSYRDNKTLDKEKDIIKAKRILESATGRKILGFRAPQMQYSSELTKILKQQGFKYDSSLNPAYFPFWINNTKYSLRPFKDNGIIEIPASTVYGSRLPLSWVFIRVLPYSYMKYGIRRLLKEGITPVLYVHSWEFIELKSKFVPWYFKKNTGKKFINKIKRLICDFKSEEFATMETLLKHNFH